MIFLGLILIHHSSVYRSSHSCLTSSTTPLRRLSTGPLAPHSAFTEARTPSVRCLCTLVTDTLMVRRKARPLLQQPRSSFLGRTTRRSGMSTAKCVESRMLASGGVGLAVGLGVMRRIRKTNLTRRLGGVGWSFFFLFPSFQSEISPYFAFLLGYHLPFFSCTLCILSS